MAGNKWQISGELWEKRLCRINRVKSEKVVLPVI